MGEYRSFEIVDGCINIDVSNKELIINSILRSISSNTIDWFTNLCLTILRDKLEIKHVDGLSKVVLYHEDIKDISKLYIEKESFSISAEALAGEFIHSIDIDPPDYSRNMNYCFKLLEDLDFKLMSKNDYYHCKIYKNNFEYLACGNTPNISIIGCYVKMILGEMK